MMAYALAELRHGVVARQHENGFKCGHNFAHTLYITVHGSRIMAFFQRGALEAGDDVGLFLGRSGKRTYSRVKYVS